MVCKTLEGGMNLWVEYQYTVEKYGQENADELFAIMLSGYKRLGILETGAYNIEEVACLIRGRVRKSWNSEE